MKRIFRFLKHDIWETRLLARLAYWYFKTRYGTSIPLAKMQQVRSLGRTENLLMQIAKDKTRLEMEDIHNKALYQEISKHSWNVAALKVSSLNFLEALIQEHQPKLIAEFGSGFSTICLAYFMRTLYPEQREIFVISFEQSEEYAEKTRIMLKESRLDAYAKVVVAPLAWLNIGEEKAFSYDLSPDLLKASFGERKADFVLIDGPWDTDWLTRYVPLVLIAPYAAKQAFFLLDDAARDRELDTAIRWSKLPYVSNLQYHVCGEGMASGTLNPS